MAVTIELTTHKENNMSFDCNMVKDEFEFKEIPKDKRVVKKPDLGYTPRDIWLERRIKRICRAIADAKDFHPEWEEELLECLNLIKKEKTICLK